jgi:hypothetical protein
MDLEFRAGRVYWHSAPVGRGSALPRIFRLIGAVDDHAVYIVLEALTKTMTGIGAKVNADKKVNLTRNHN